MKNSLLKQFIQEMASKRPEAFLPRNLSDFWLDLLLEEADTLFADEEDEPKTTETGDAAGLVFCVLRIFDYQRRKSYPRRKSIKIRKQKLLEYLESYTLSLRLERISRLANMQVEDTSTLENIFDPNRMMSLRRIEDA